MCISPEISGIFPIGPMPIAYPEHQFRKSMIYIVNNPMFHTQQ